MQFGIVNKFEFRHFSKKENPFSVTGFLLTQTYILWYTQIVGAGFYLPSILLQEDTSMIPERLRRAIFPLLQKNMALVAIDGSCTSGKTTLAAALQSEYPCQVIAMDDFFLRPSQRTPERMAQVGGNVDYERFQEEVLSPLRSGHPACYRPYCCRTGTLLEPVTVEPRGLIVIEGSYSQHPYFGNPYDLRIFLEHTPSLQRERVLQRPAHLQKKFFELWIPMENAYFEAFQIAEKADLILEQE